MFVLSVPMCLLLKDCNCTPMKKSVYLLMALFREVTSLYRTENTDIHPKPEVRTQHVQQIISQQRTVFSDSQRVKRVKSCGEEHFDISRLKNLMSNENPR